MQAFAVGGPPAATGPPRPFSWFAPSTVATCGATGEGPKSLTELAMQETTGFYDRSLTRYTRSFIRKCSELLSVPS